MRIENEVKLDFKDVLIRPKRSTLSTRSNVDVSREFRFRHAQVDYHGVPIIAANMDTTGTIEMARALDSFQLSTALHKHYSIDELVAFFAGLERKSAAFYSMGITAADEEKFDSVLAAAGAAATSSIPYVCIDVANGYTEGFVRFVAKIRERHPHLVIIAGNDECSGDVVERDGRKFQRFYGMSSRTAMEKYAGGVAQYRAAEGKEVLVPSRGPVAATAQEILGGVRSACTYVGARRLRELSKRTTFVRVSQQLNETFGKS